MGSGHRSERNDRADLRGKAHSSHRADAQNAEFLGWFTEATGGTQVTANDVFTETADKTYYAHWGDHRGFSVTVPVTLPLIVDEGGEVHVGAAEIINASTGDVIVSSVSISTKNGWQPVPYTTDMAHERLTRSCLALRSMTRRRARTAMQKRST